MSAQTEAETEGLKKVLKMLNAMERQLIATFRAYSESPPHLQKEWLKHFRGIGDVLTANIIARFGDMSRFDNIGKLWAFCGLSATHYVSECKKGHKLISSSPKTKCPIFAKRAGKRTKCEAEMVAPSELVNSPPRRTKGHFLLIDHHSKVLAWKIARQFEFLKPNNSYYRRVYDRFKARYAAREDIKQQVQEKSKGKGYKGRIRNMALRATAKRFLADYWVSCRTMYDLPVTKPYAVDKLKHQHYEEPQFDRE